MVYKIRNKGFQAVFGGTQNVRAYPARKVQVNVDLSTHVTLQVQVLVTVPPPPIIAFFFLVVPLLPFNQYDSFSGCLLFSKIILWSLFTRNHEGIQNNCCNSDIIMVYHGLTFNCNYFKCIFRHN